MKAYVLMLSVAAVVCMACGTKEAKDKSASAVVVFDTVASKPYTDTTRVKPDIIKVEFGKEHFLYWDRVNHGILDDENSSSILRNKKNIRSVAYFITNEDVVCDVVCGKKNALRKGDIAFLFIWHSQWMCHLGRQFCSYECGFPVGLLDYVESDRDVVFQKVMSCLDSKGIPR
jgi:hypothetical protein